MKLLKLYSFLFKIMTLLSIIVQKKWGLFFFNFKLIVFVNFSLFVNVVNKAFNDVNEIRMK